MRNQISRRNILRVGCLTAGALTSGFSRLGLMNAFAQSSSGSGGDYRALVCVFLFGGNDGNNLIVPNSAAGYQQYAGVRQVVALPQNTLLPVMTATGGVAYGLHPNLAEIRTLFNSQKAAVVANLGMLVMPTTRAQYTAGNWPVPANLFSHSDQQAEWQSAIPTGTGGTGWGGRVADATAALNSPSTFPTAVSLAGSSLFVNGASTQPASVNAGSNSLGLNVDTGTAAATARDQAFQDLLTFDNGAVLVQAASQTMQGSIKVAKLLNHGVPLDRAGPAAPRGGAHHPGARATGHAAADLLLLARRLRYAHRRAGRARHAVRRAERSHQRPLQRHRRAGS